MFNKTSYVLVENFFFSRIGYIFYVDFLIILYLIRQIFRILIKQFTLKLKLKFMQNLLKYTKR